MLYDFYDGRCSNPWARRGISTGLVTVSSVLSTPLGDAIGRLMAGYCGGEHGGSMQAVVMQILAGEVAAFVTFHMVSLDRLTTGGFEDSQTSLCSPSV